MSGLPEGWAAARLSEFCDLNPRVDKSAFNDEDRVAFVPMPAVGAETGMVDVSKERSFATVRQGYTAFMAGDVLFAKITPCMENGKMAVVPVMPSEYGFGSTEFHVLRPEDGVNPAFVCHLVSNRTFRFQAEHMMTGAVGQKRVPVSVLEKHEVALPPVNEQRRIVERIETLFAEIDAGVKSLEAARTALGLYRQSLLKAAFEGRLTEGWRAANPDKLETPDALLARIYQERESRHVVALAEWKAACTVWENGGREGKKPVRPRRLSVALPAERMNNKISLPDGWSSLAVNSLCEVVRGGSPRPAGDERYYGGDIPFLKVADLTRTPGMYVSEAAHSIKSAGLSKTRMVSRDTLMISNSGATLGVPKICRIETTFNDGVAAFLGLDEDERKFHYWFWIRMMPTLRAINQGAAQPNLNTSLLGAINIPQCSPAEQAEIVRVLDTRLSATDALGDEIEGGLKRADALRQSILTQAFSGKLVPQNPDDEPASVLLDRIRAERAAKPKTKRRRKAKEPS